MDAATDAPFGIVTLADFLAGVDDPTHTPAPLPPPRAATPTPLASSRPAGPSPQRPTATQNGIAAAAGVLFSGGGGRGAAGEGAAAREEGAVGMGRAVAGGAGGGMRVPRPMLKLRDWPHSESFREVSWARDNTGRAWCG